MRNSTATIIILSLIIVLGGILYYMDKKGSSTIVVPAEPNIPVSVQINPGKDIVSNAPIVKVVEHNVNIPKSSLNVVGTTKMPVKITVTDPNTKEVINQNGEASITTTPEGDVNVSLDDIVTVTPVLVDNYKFKIIIASTPDIMIGYTIGKLNLLKLKLDTDVMAGFISIGIGETIECGRFSFGVGETYNVEDAEFKTVIYGAYSF